MTAKMSSTYGSETSHGANNCLPGSGATQPCSTAEGSGVSKMELRRWARPRKNIHSLLTCSRPTTVCIWFQTDHTGKLTWATMPLSLRWRLILSQPIMKYPGTLRSNCCPKMMWCWPTFSLLVLGRAKQKQSQHTKTGRITLNETIASKSAKKKPINSYRQNRQSGGMHRYVKSCALNFAELAIVFEIYDFVAAGDCADLASPSFCTFHFVSCR